MSNPNLPPDPSKRTSIPTPTSTPHRVPADPGTPSPSTASRTATPADPAPGPAALLPAYAAQQLQLTPIVASPRAHEITQRLMSRTWLAPRYLLPGAAADPLAKSSNVAQFSQLARAARPRYRPGGGAGEHARTHAHAARRRSTAPSHGGAAESATGAGTDDAAAGSAGAASGAAGGAGAAASEAAFAGGLGGRDPALPSLTESGDSNEASEEGSLMECNEAREKAVNLWKLVRTFVSKKFFSGHTAAQHAVDHNPFFAEMAKVWAQLVSSDPSHPPPTPAPLHADPSASSLAEDWATYSLDTVADVHVAALCALIHTGLADAAALPVGAADVVVALPYQLTAWRVAVLALRREEPLDRLLALHLVAGCMPGLPRTCRDPDTRTRLAHVLMDVARNDALVLNRHTALHVLGLCAHTLALEQAWPLAMDLFEFLSDELHGIQAAPSSSCGTSGGNGPGEDTLALKLELFLALSKFLKCPTEVPSIRNVILYLVYHEMKYSIQPNLENPTYLPLIEGLMTILSMIEHSDTNLTYMGALFQEFIQPMMTHPSIELQKLGIYFASLWLPITHHRAHCIKFQILLEGHAQVLPTPHSAQTKAELERLLRQEETQLERRNRTCWHLLQMPGTSCFLSPLLGAPGWFGCAEPLMPFTSAILLFLPINSDDAILLSRPLPRLDGVPSNATTVPPVFMDPNFAMSLPMPASPYEQLERDGGVPGLPPGFTYNPRPYAQPFKDAPAAPAASTPYDRFLNSSVPYGFSLESFHPIPESTSAAAAAHGGGAPPPCARVLSFKSSSSKIELDDPRVQNGYTPVAQPLIFPYPTSLAPELPNTEFLINAPVILDVPLPEQSLRLQTRILYRDKHFDPLVVEDRGYLSPGARFHLHVRDRQNIWHTVHLLVEGTEVQHVEINSAVRANPPAIQVDGLALFAPPVNVSPLPVLYTTDGEPLYAKPPALHPPTTLTGELTAPTLPLVGFDALGRPFYLPKGCKLPSPAGYSRDGIPFYDIASMLLERGTYVGGCYEPMPDADFREYLSRCVSGSRSFRRPPLLTLDSVRHYEDVGHLKAVAIKTSFDPPTLQFQSVSETVTKPCLLKYRTPRGDYLERECFICIEPADVFSVDVFHVKLQGEGILQLKVSCFPEKIGSMLSCQGTLSLIDETGKRYETCHLVALKKSFVKLLPMDIRFGWVLPNQLMSMELMCANVSNTIVHLHFKSTDKLFRLSDTTLKLQAKESKIILVTFEPSVVGTYAATIEVDAPAGEVLVVKVHGACGVPVVLHPESSEDALCGPTLLVRERSLFISKIFKLLETESVISLTTSLPEREQALFTSLLHAIDPVGRHPEPVCIDFGVVPDALTASATQEGLPPTIVRYLTIFNISVEAMLCCVSSSSAELTLEPLVRVAPYKANLIPIHFHSDTTGPFRGNLYITCPGFATIVCHVRAYVGCPLLFTSLQTAWMEPKPLLQTSVIQLPMVNLSELELEGTLELIFEKGMFSTPSSKLTFKPYSMNWVEVHCCVDKDVVWCMVQVFVQHLRSNSIQCVASPLWENLSLQDLESLIHWLGQVHFPFPPASAVPPLLCNQVRQALDPKTMPTLHLPSTRIHALEKITCTGFAERTHLLLSPGWSLPKMTSHVWVPTESKDYVIDIEMKSCNIPLESYGFLMAYPESTHPIVTPLICSPLLMVFPIPSFNGDVFELTLDFGIMESKTSPDYPSCHRSVLMVNTRDKNVYWTARIRTGKGRHIPFEVANSSGILKGAQTDLLVIQCHPTIQGVFDAPCELKYHENVNTEASPVFSESHSYMILLRVRVILTHIKGLPLTHDFGNCVSGSTEEFQFKLENVCNIPVKINFLAKAPFHVQSNSFVLFHDSEQNVHLSFCPTDSSNYLTQMIPCFMNHIVKSIRVSGMGGTVRLCSNLLQNNFDFGSIPTSSIAWISFSLTNKGTLPLRLEHVLSPRPDLLLLQLIKKQFMASTNTFELQKDYWGFVKSKLKLLAFLGRFMKRKAVIAPSMKPSLSFGQPDFALPVPLDSSTSKPETTRLPITTKPIATLVEAGIDPEKIQLQPMETLSFKLGFSPTNQTKQYTQLAFQYLPVISQQREPAPCTLSFDVVGQAHRFLDFHPISLDFGLHPVFLFKKSIFHAVQDSLHEVSKAQENMKSIRISNLGLEVQSVSLILSTSNYKMPDHSDTGDARKGDTLPNNVRFVRKSNAKAKNTNQTLETCHLSAFHIQGRQWTLGPGCSVHVPVYFVPNRPQMQYCGEAYFQHDHGVSLVQFKGTGGTAEVRHTDDVNFGSVPLHLEKTLTFSLTNKGLLDSTVFLQINKNGPFRFRNTDPYEIEVSVGAGDMETVTMSCTCNQKEHFFKSFMTVKWLRTPNDAKPIIKHVRLMVEVGFPLFSLDRNDLDFGTVYTSKTLPITLRNEGNAGCDWLIKPDPALEFSCTKGTLTPKSADEIQITFHPTKFEPLESQLEFVVGEESFFLFVTGIVGMPYLLIPHESLMLDFGIVEINQDHQLEIPLINSGPHDLDFTFEVHQETPIFLAQPSKGTISPKDQVNVVVITHPIQFSVVYSCTWVATSVAGEKYEGSCSCIGGQAIVKLGSLFPTDEPSLDASLSASETPALTRLPSPEVHFLEQAALALQEHVQIMFQIFKDLSSDEAKELEQELQAIDQNKRARTPQRLTSMNAGKTPTPESLRAESAASTRRLSIRSGKEGATLLSGLDRTALTAVLPPIGTSTPGGDVQGGDMLADSFSNFTSSKRRPSTSKSPPKSATPSRPHSSCAKERWLEGSLFNLKDVQTPVGSLYSDSKRALRQLATKIDEKMKQNPKLISPAFLESFLNPKMRKQLGLPMINELGQGLETDQEGSSDFQAERNEKMRDDFKSLGSQHGISEAMGSMVPSAEWMQRGDAEGSRARHSTMLSPSGKPGEGIRHVSAASAGKPPGSGTTSLQRAGLIQGQPSEQKNMDGTSPLNLVSDFEGIDEDLLESSVEAVGDPLLSSKNIPEFLQGHIKNCKQVIETLQDHIPHMHDSTRLQILQKSANALIYSTAMVENVLYKFEDDTQQLAVPGAVPKLKTFDLGLHLSGAKLVDKFLFNLPNVGNLPFSFSTFINPPEMRKYFSISPSVATIAPGENVPLSVTFTAETPGTYRVECGISTQGKDEVCFAVQTTAGSAQLEVDRHILDFGLQCINTVESQALVLSNVGNYKEMINIALDVPHFKLREGFTEFEIQQDEKMDLNIDFQPTQVGLLSATWRLVPSMLPPISIELKGEGGCPSIAVDPKEMLRFPDLFAGQSIQKPIHIINTGTWDGKLGFTLEWASPLTLFYNEAPLGLTPIEVKRGKTVTILADFAPQEQLYMETQLFIDEFISNTHYALVLTGSSGEFSVGAEGEVSFANLKVDTCAECSITFTNYGNFPVQLEFEITPEEVQPYFSLLQNRKELTENHFELRAGDPTTFVLQTCPKTMGVVTAQLIVVASCTIQEECRSNEFSYNFSYMAYEQALMISDAKEEVDFGVWAAGKTSDFEFGLTNYDTRTALVRGHIEVQQDTTAAAPGAAAPPAPLQRKESPQGREGKAGGGKAPKGKGKLKRSKGKGMSSEEIHAVEEVGVHNDISLAWSLPVDSLMLASGETGQFVARFLATQQINVPQTGTLILEYSLDNGATFLPLHSYAMKGQSGLPKVELKSNQLNFGYVPCNAPSILKVEFTNTGTASTTWSLEREWPYQQIFRLHSEAEGPAPPTSGPIHVGETIELAICFQCREPRALQTSVRIYVEGSPTPLEAHMVAETCEFKILEYTLPTRFDMPCEINGPTLGYPLTLMNDCVFDIPLTFELQCETPVSEHSWESTLSVVPSIVTLPKNVAGSDCSQVTVTLYSTPPSSVLITLEELTLLLHSGIAFNLQITSPSLTKTYSIPCALHFASQPIQHDELMSIDFGELHYEKSATKAFSFQNSNPFHVVVSAESDHPQLALVEPDPALLPASTSALTVKVAPQIYEKEEDIPVEAMVSGTLTLHFTCLKQSVTIQAMAKFVDLQIPPEFHNLDFGEVLVSSKENVQKVTWQNWTRRALTYHVQMEKEVVPADTASMFLESELDGELRPHAPATLVVRFVPPKLGTYTVPVHLITSSGAFTFELSGKGILPDLKLAVDEIDFGAIGVVELRTLRVTNGSAFHVDFQCTLTSSDFFLVIPATVLALEPHQGLELTIQCTPPPQGEDICSILQLVTMEGVIVQECSLRAAGGQFEVRPKCDPTVAFPVIEPMEMATLPIVFENTGTTKITLAFTDPATMLPIKRGQELVGKSGRCAFGCVPITLQLLPGESKKFNVSVTGMQEGDDELKLIFKTQGQLEPLTFEFDATTKIAKSTVPSTKVNKKAMSSFAKSDVSIEASLSIDYIERTKFRSDEGISNILLKVVCIQAHSSLLISQTPYPPVEPDCAPPDLGELLLRPRPFPSASPIEGVKKGKAPASTATSASGYPVASPWTQEREVRKHDAERMVQPVEHQVNLVAPKRQKNKYQ